LLAGLDIDPAVIRKPATRNLEDMAIALSDVRLRPKADIGVSIVAAMELRK